MTAVRLEIGSTVDLLTKGEMDEAFTGYEMTRASGVKYTRMPRLYATPASGTVVLGTTSPWAGPHSGYCWSIQRLSCTGLGTGNTPDILNIYRNGTNTDPVWQLNGNTFGYTFGRGEFILLPGEFIQAASLGSLVSTTQVTLNADVFELPAEMLGKVLLLWPRQSSPRSPGQLHPAPRRWHWHWMTPRAR